MKRLLAFLIVGVAMAETLHVPQDYPTIQSALDSLDAGDTVLVAVGVYAEALTAPPLSFVLRGDVTPDTGDYPRPVVDPSSLLGSQFLACLVTWTPSGGQVVLEDFIFRNGAAMYPRTIYDAGGILNNSDDLTVRRCVFDSTYEALAPCPGRTTLENCRFVDVQEYAVRGGVPSSRIRASDCSFSGNGAFYIYCRDSTELIRCAFYDSSNTARSTFLMCWASARYVSIRECVFGPALGGIWAPLELWGVNGVIENNVFRDLQPNEPALYLRCACEDTTFIRGNLFVNITDCRTSSLRLECQSGAGLAAVIENNTVMNCAGTDTMGKAIRLFAGAHVEGNRFQSLEQAGRATIFQNGYRPGMEIHWNRFNHTGYAYYVWPVPPDPVDAHFNWWGDSTGPYHRTQNPFGHGDTVSDGVDFVPWLSDTLASVKPGTDFLLPAAFAFEAYPNPFNSTVHLMLIPAEVQIVKVELFDILGRRVQEIWKGPLAFQKEITFDASALASGIYFARAADVISRKQMAMRKLVLLK